MEELLHRMVFLETNMAQIDDIDTTRAQAPHRARFSKSPERSSSDVRERFARRQQRKLEEKRLQNAKHTLHLPTELTRSSAFMSPIIQATLKRSRETSNHASALVSPTSVTHSIPRESHVVVVENNSNSKDENLETDADDQNAVSRRPMLCAVNSHNANAPPRLRRLQGRESLLDSAIFISSCGTKRCGEDEPIRRNVQASQHFPEEKSLISEELTLPKTTQLACRTDANTKKFAYQTFVDARLWLGRTVTDCTVFSKDVYRLNSSEAHRQRDDDLNFFLHESGNYEDEALKVTQPPEQLRSRSHARALGVESSDVFNKHTPSRADNNFQITADSSDFAQLLMRANANDIPFLPRATKSKASLDTFRTQFKDKPSWPMDDERKISSRAVTEGHQARGDPTRGPEIRLNPKSTTGRLRLPSKPKLQDDFDLHLDAQRWQLDDRSDYKNPIHWNILYGLPDSYLETNKSGRDLQTYTEQTLSTSEESNIIENEMRSFSSYWDFDTEATRNENKGTHRNAASVPMELASLHGEIEKLRTQIAEARSAHFVPETDNVQAILDRDRYHTEVHELETWVSKVDQEEREI